MICRPWREWCSTVAADQRPRPPRQVAERADDRHRRAVGERHLGDRELPVLGDEAEELDRPLALERIAARRPGVDQRLLFDLRCAAHPDSEALMPAG